MKSTLRAVDSLEVLVLVDNALDPLSSVPKGVTNDFPVHMRGGMRVASGHARCCANHGLSLVLTAKTGSDIQILLFDAGPEAYSLARNADRLRIPLGEVGGIVLSHGHWDHSGGLPEAVRLVAAANGSKSVPCHVNDGMFVTRGLRLGDGRVLPFEDVPGKTQLTGLGAAIDSAAEARTLQEGAFYLSGEIPRVTTYEKGFPPHLCLGADGAWAPDPLLLDERYVAVNVRDRGLVVFTACSHAGVVNVLRSAAQAFPDLPVHAVMGGFHLAGADMEGIIDDTVRDMAGFGMKRIVPCHCTGWRALNAMARAFGDDVVVPGAVGRLFNFSA